MVLGVRTEMAKLIERLSERDRAIIEQAQLQVPVKLGDISQSLGLSVKASTLPAGVSGEIRPQGNSFEIKVNRHDSRGRQRFTVAHELAHYLLHRDQIGSGLTDDVLYRSSLSDAREAEANRLAAQILMPRESVLDAVRKYNGNPEQLYADLAHIFGVSEMAMRIRIENF